MAHSKFMGKWLIDSQQKAGTVRRAQIVGQNVKFERSAHCLYFAHRIVVSPYTSVSGEGEIEATAPINLKSAKKTSKVRRLYIV
jgi:hypothetical protein